jgi:hypothetical protein
MPVTCPAGHQSQTADYCDVCGVAVDSAGAPPAATPASDPVAAAPGAGPVSADLGGRCPDCGTPHGPGDAFCEVCGVDFATGARPAPPPPPVPAAAAPAAPAAAPTGWTAVVEVDPEFFATNQPDDAAATFSLPSGTPPREIPLAGDELLIGRADGRAGGPAIDLGVAPEDPGVSHRHARLARRGDGWVVIDLDSTNGTRVGGGTNPIAPGAEVALSDGDHLLLGVWTRITLRRPDPAAAP